MTEKQLTAGTVMKYRAAWKQKAKRRLAALEQRRDEAGHNASRLAAIISRYPGVNKVTLFGSTLVSGRFHEKSDIDFAVWGLRPEDYFKLLNKLENATDFSVDLVPAEDARPQLLKRIDKGKILYERKND